jgi:hypothetical protein
VPFPSDVMGGKVGSTGGLGLGFHQSFSQDDSNIINTNIKAIFFIFGITKLN